MGNAVVKLFADPSAAVNAIRELQSKGLKAGDIGVVVKKNGGSEMVARRAEMALTAKADDDLGEVALGGPAAGSDSMSSLAALWGVPSEVLFYYESGLRRGGVVVSVHDETKAGDAKAALRAADSVKIIPLDPPINDRPFYLSERVTKSDDRDKMFSGDFRKY